MSQIWPEASSLKGHSGLVHAAAHKAEWAESRGPGTAHVALPLGVI
jgi:hypothetical protein